MLIFVLLAVVGTTNFPIPADISTVLDDIFVNTQTFLHEVLFKRTLLVPRPNIDDDSKFRLWETAMMRFDDADSWKAVDSGLPARLQANEFEYKPLQNIAAVLDSAKIPFEIELWMLPRYFETPLDTRGDIMIFLLGGEFELKVCSDSPQQENTTCQIWGLEGTDIAYIPSSTVRTARALKEDIAIFISISLATNDFTWQTLLQESEPSIIPITSIASKSDGELSSLLNSVLSIWITETPSWDGLFKVYSTLVDDLHHFALVNSTSTTFVDWTRLRTMDSMLRGFRSTVKRGVTKKISSKSQSLMIATCAAGDTCETFGGEGHLSLDRCGCDSSCGCDQNCGCDGACGCDAACGCDGACCIWGCDSACDSGCGCDTACGCDGACGCDTACGCDQCTGCFVPETITCGSTITGDTSNSPNLIGDISGDQIFSFSVDTTTTVEFSNCGTLDNFNTLLEIHDSSLSSCIATSTRCGPGFSPLQSRVESVLSSGDYRLVVQGYGSSSGVFDVTFSRCDVSVTVTPTTSNSPTSTSSMSMTITVTPSRSTSPTISTSSSVSVSPTPSTPLAFIVVGTNRSGSGLVRSVFERCHFEQGSVPNATQ
eukprot:c10117_g2_i2.p1 GENE.c10117_g2_i2~~c10117_g2_i2.p1  ORF type:complete len:599 (+),score=110.51 c10117_g2_i2:29-1825(+)